MIAIIICKVPQGNRCFWCVLEKVLLVAGILLNGSLKSRNAIKEQKTLSVEMRRARDCDIRAVTDSALEVFMESPTSILQKTSAVVYKAHIMECSSTGRAALSQ